MGQRTGAYARAMLAATAPPARGYEGLNGYFLGGRGGGGGPPGSVPSALAPSPRLATTPGAVVPGPPATIPTSSQKPTQGTNVRIPYARFMYTSPTDDAAPRDLQRGDVVFAHRQSLAMGRGGNRLVKCTGLPQLNDMLARGGTSDGQSDRSGCLDLRVPAVRQRVQAARVRYYEGAKTRAEFDLRALDNRNSQGAPQTQRLAEARQAAQQALADANAKLAAAATFATGAVAITAADYDLAADAAAVPLLRDFLLDGVLINVDDDVLDVETPRDARNDGLLLNVAIGGPTPLRNAARTVGAVHENQLLPRNSFTPQLVDATPLARDTVVALLVGTPVATAADGDLSDPATARYYRFAWKLGSFRQIYELSAPAGSEPRGATRREGITARDVARSWGAFQIGSVTDTNLVASPGKDRQIMINVAVDWMSPEELRQRVELT